MSDRYEITLDSGITIILVCLFQYRAYAGFLEGIPSRKMNAGIIATAVRYAEEKLWRDGTPHVLTPPEVPSGAPDDPRTPIRIPLVASLATFDAMVPARDRGADFSSLNVVWFQDAFGPPRQASVLNQFRKLDWQALATDGSW